MEEAPKIRASKVNLHHKRKSWYTVILGITFHQPRKACNTRRFLCKCRARWWFCHHLGISTRILLKMPNPEPERRWSAKPADLELQHPLGQPSNHHFKNLLHQVFSAGKNRIIKNYHAPMTKAGFRTEIIERRGLLYYYTTNPNNAVFTEILKKIEGNILASSLITSKIGGNFPSFNDPC